MGHDWVIAQLDAMERYCRINDLPHLADTLAEARLLANVEIAGKQADGGLSLLIGGRDGRDN